MSITSGDLGSVNYYVELGQLTPADYIIVNDGVQQYPIVRALLLEGDTERRVRAMGGEEYAAWCRAVPMDDSQGRVGSQGCINFCNWLIENGADFWRVG